MIGTLYCANHNYEFGVGCVIKALEPLDKKLSTDTWFHAKRCLVAMIEVRLAPALHCTALETLVNNDTVEEISVKMFDELL